MSIENDRIIYPDDTGKVIVIIPAPKSGMALEDIATKDVPTDKPYKLVTVDDIPSDRSGREAWEDDFSNPDGYGQ